MNYFEKLYYHHWNIGFIEKSIQDVLLSDCTHVEVHWVKHPYIDRFFADPFILSVSDEEIKVLVEDFPYYDKRGRISMLTVDRESYHLTKKTTILKQPFHMSYPFIMRKKDGEIWVAPEASESGNLYYYFINSETINLENQKLLVAEPLLDSTIVEYNKLWWLFCTKVGENSDKDLYVYYSDNPEGPFKPHTCNPVVSNLSLARPGGYMIEHDNILYRVCQESKNCYGECINVTRIDKLTPSEFKQTFIKSIKAQNDEYSGGFHTINGLSDICVVDGLRTEFAPIRRVIYESINFLKRKW